MLLRASPLAPELPGLFDLAPGVSADPLFGSAGFVAEVAPVLGLATPASRPAERDFEFARARVAGYAVVGTPGEDYEPSGVEAPIDILPDGL